MSIFTNIDEKNLSFDKHKVTIDNIISNLNGYANLNDIKELNKLKSNFEFKIKDFFNKDRKLNIGVVGQVKAGKSSFLNSLLFSGHEVLPKASTPKTATLTKMEYSDENMIQIEYYTMDEWSVIEDNATIDKDDDVYTSAREIIKMAKCIGINPDEHLEKGTETIKFDTYNDLIANLNDYVGEDGKYTPLVKAVTLYLNNEEFKGLSIVDTPGLNDPIVSRTIKTREFIEVCDVVFFLSQSMYFLDKSDWTLLSSQLPQKGVKKLILVASKYDSGIRDVLKPEEEIDDLFGEDENAASDIPKACSLIENKLTKRAKQKVVDFVNDLVRREASEELINIIKECNKPIMVSAMCFNMSNKLVSEYNDEEMNIYNALLCYSDNIQNDLKYIGNMSKIQQIFDDIATEKENILRHKADASIDERIGTRTQIKKYRVSTSKWYKPWTWGSSRTEYYSYEEHYSYLDVSDAVNNLTNYSSEAANDVENVFKETVQFKEMRRKLLNVVTNNFDMSNEKYDSSIFRMIVEQTLNNIEFPVIKIDINQMINQVASEFTGEITSSEQKTSLNRALTNSISKILNEMCNKLEESVKDFKAVMDKMYCVVQDSLLENINTEFADILTKYDDKEKEINSLNEYINKLDFEIKKL